MYGKYKIQDTHIRYKIGAKEWKTLVKTFAEFYIFFSDGSVAYWYILALLALTFNQM